MGKSGEPGESGGTRADVMPHGRANKP